VIIVYSKEGSLFFVMIKATVFQNWNMSTTSLQYASHVFLLNYFESQILTSPLIALTILSGFLLIIAEPSVTTAAATSRHF
jgi:hypothetical protein